MQPRVTPLTRRREDAEEGLAPDAPCLPTGQH